MKHAEQKAAATVLPGASVTVIDLRTDATKSKAGETGDNETRNPLHGVRVSGMSIRAGWMAEPLERAGDEFEKIRDWLKQNRALKWDVIDSIARYFHPDYMYETKTRKLRADRVSGAPVYLMMERGEFKLALIRGLAPTIFKKLPAKFRGVPIEFSWNVFHVSAWLACHEYERLCEAHRDAPHDNEKLARHLYWFTRFSSLWQRTHAAKPKNWDVILAKRTAANKWHEDLRKYFADYRTRHPTATIRGVVKAFLRPCGEEHPSFAGHYRWALKNLQ